MIAFFEILWSCRFFLNNCFGIEIIVFLRCREWGYGLTSDLQHLHLEVF